MIKKTTVKIPVNIITGFLGAGKTTVIRHLLKSKPSHEKWAVLVNEFGEIGIDGELLSSDDIAVKEVAGGCICCSVRLPSQTALAGLIEEQQPDRLIIEPTGLALPAQILDMLSTNVFKDLLDVRATICLVDPWCFMEKHFMTLPTFAEQISMSDIVVATKKDIAATEHLRAFNDFATQHKSSTKTFLAISYGALDWRLLTQKRQVQGDMPTELTAKYNHNLPSKKENSSIVYDEEGVLKSSNKSKFGCSCGWQFNAEWLFDKHKLLDLFQNVDIPRIKGIFATPEGWIVINKVRQTIADEVADKGRDSRVEMINMVETDWDLLDKKIRECKHITYIATQSIL